MEFLYNLFTETFTTKCYKGHQMKRCAFIDVQNTETTTLKVLGFEVDHQKLYLYLTEKWHCEKVFFYPGIEYGDTERENIFKNISDIGGIVRPKYYYKYKNSDKVKIINCPKCNIEIIHKTPGSIKKYI